MSTFLELTKDLRAEVDIPGTGPVTVVSQTGEAANLVRWTKNAYIEIQSRNKGNWRWLRREFTLPTIADTDTYVFGDCTDTTSAAVIDRFRAWRFNDREDPPKIYLTSAGVGGESYLSWVPWEWFKNLYKLGPQTSSRPVHISVDPNDQIVIGPAPNDIYTITGDYWRSPQILSLDGDTPEMPAHFHYAIVYLAMHKYGFQQLAPEQIEWARSEYRKMIRNLESEQMTRVDLGAPMV